MVNGSISSNTFRRNKTMSVTGNRQGEEAEQTLLNYGYRQEFRRELKRFASFAVGFSFISITTGIFSTYGGVLNWGGPLGIWTWPFVVVGQLFVAFVFAALASRMPLAGYSYQWVSRLVNPKVGWLVGWVSFMFLTIVTNRQFSTTPCRPLSSQYRGNA